MKASDIPTQKWVEPWAKNAPLTNLNVIPLTTASLGFASQDQGFPPECGQPTDAGGKPPRIQDENGAMQFLSAWTIWMTAGGGLVPWDSAFSTAIGGYPSGQVVLSATTPGAYYVSTADDNTSNPDAGGANWVAGSLYGSFTTGDVKLSYKTTADAGFIPMNDGTVGSATSGSTYANPNAQPLFSLMFNNIVDTWAPLFTSGGASTNRAAFGNNPTTAWAANARLTLPKALGRALAGAGAGAGLTARALGSIFGEETHTMTLAELVPHDHTWGYGLTPVGSTGSQQADRQDPDNHNTTGSAGGGTPFNVMQPTTFLNIFVKL